MDDLVCEATEVADGQRLVFRRSGKGAATIMVHGWGGSSRYWLGALNQLGTERAVYALDLPGFGQSPPLATPSLAGLASAVLAFADQLALPRFDLVGHSLGAALALMVAKHAPERVRRLALVSLGLPTSRSAALWAAQANLGWHAAHLSWGAWLQLARPLRWPNGAGLTAAWANPFALHGLALGVMRHQPNEALLRAGLSDLLAMDGASALAATTAIGDLSLAAIARQVAIPTRAISGQDDPIFSPAMVQALASQMPQASALLLSDCGHVPMVEQPTRFLKALAAWLREGQRSNPG